MASKTTVALAHEGIACLRRLSDAFRRRREVLALSVGLSDGQWMLLEEIATEHFMPSMFARNRESSAAAVSKALRQLKGKGLVSVGLSKTDGRHRAYLLTTKAKRLLETLRQEREQAIQTIWLPLDPAQVQTFVAFATQLSDRMEQYGTNHKET
jgi:DNA-binding MarR family transcriptional regulator